MDFFFVLGYVGPPTEEPQVKEEGCPLWPGYESSRREEGLFGLGTRLAGGRKASLAWVQG